MSLWKGSKSKIDSLKGSEILEIWNQNLKILGCKNVKKLEKFSRVDFRTLKRASYAPILMVEFVLSLCSNGRWFSYKSCVETTLKNQLARSICSKMATPGKKFSWFSCHLMIRNCTYFIIFCLGFIRNKLANWKSINFLVISSWELLRKSSAEIQEANNTVPGKLFHSYVDFQDLLRVFDDLANFIVSK